MNCRQQRPSAPTAPRALLRHPGRGGAAALRCPLSHSPHSAPSSALNPRVKTPTERFILLIQEALFPSWRKAEQAQDLAVLTSSISNGEKV